jgi:uncharacterized protein
MVPVTNDGLALLRRIDRGEPVSEAAQAEFMELLDPDYGVLVPDLAEDERRFGERMVSLRTNKHHISVVISTSLACNFGCTYCLQDGVMNGKTMSFDTVHKTGRWIVERMRAENVESVALAFVGGEPLLHPHIIEGVARQVGKAARDDGRAFSFVVTTNGWFLDLAMAKRLKALGCESCRITLDGDETTHDHTRPLKGGGSSFQRIWDNLIAVAGTIPIIINGHYTPETLPGFVPLLEKMQTAGLTREVVPAVAFTPALDILAAPESGSCKSSTLSGTDAIAMLNLSDAAAAAGYQVPDGIDLGPCGFHNRNHFGIDPDGNVYKCGGFLGMPEWRISTVDSQSLGPLYDKALAPGLLHECGDCSNRPSCAGGCVATTWIATKSTEYVQCDQPYFKTVGIEAIRRKWRLTQSEAQ